MRHFALAILILCAAGVAQGATKKREPYHGPLGLKWGQSKADVKAALESRYELTDEKDGYLEYSGEFSGLATGGLVAFFTNGELAAFFVGMPEADVRPRSRVWEELIDLVTSSYGPPDEITRAPPSPGDGLRSAKSRRGRELGEVIGSAVAPIANDIRDLEIKKGNWKPNALWKFPNKAVIRVYVNAGEPGEDGDRPLYVVLSFADQARMDAAKASKPRDF